MNFDTVLTGFVLAVVSIVLYEILKIILTILKGWLGGQDRW